MHTTHTLSGSIYRSGPAPTADGTSAVFTVLNRSGGINTFNVTYSVTYSGGYSSPVSAFGSDCLVAAQVDPGGAPFFVVKSQVDLSAASPPAVDLTGDPAAAASVSLTGYAGGSQAQLAFATRYGHLSAQIVVLAGAGTYTVTDPYGYQGSWLQAQQGPDNDPATGFRKIYMSSSLPAAIGTSVSLPALNTSLGPTPAPDAGTLSYTGGTLSIATVAGTDMYVFFLVNPSTSGQLGMILSPAPSVSLPSWLGGRLAGMTCTAQVRTAPTSTWT